jgi:UDP-N-acetylglucosamine enolpyruvyl transferase
VYYFRVTGDTNGPLWGTDVYTGDSALAVAAVHAGLVAPGATAILRVTVEQPLRQYQGSTRNGVASHDFGPFGTAYRISAV